MHNTKAVISQGYIVFLFKSYFVSLTFPEVVIAIEVVFLIYGSARKRLLLAHMKEE